MQWLEPDCDDWDDVHERLGRLVDAYIASPEGRGEDTTTLMTRLAVSVAAVIPDEIRKRLVEQFEHFGCKHW